MTVEHNVLGRRRDSTERRHEGDEEEVPHGRFVSKAA